VNFKTDSKSPSEKRLSQKRRLWFCRGRLDVQSVRGGQLADRAAQYGPRTLGENLLLVCLPMAPPSQALEPPANPGQYIYRQLPRAPILDLRRWGRPRRSSCGSTKFVNSGTIGKIELATRVGGRGVFGQDTVGQDAAIRLRLVVSECPLGRYL
jgi:hypothetical protein